MGANRWSVCPRCVEEAEHVHDAEIEAVYDQYGKIPVDEFDRLRSGLIAFSEEPYLTFREDWEIGAYDGVAVANYRGSCKECGLKVDFTHSKKFWPEAE